MRSGTRLGESGRPTRVISAPLGDADAESSACAIACPVRDACHPPSPLGIRSQEGYAGPSMLLLPILLQAAGSAAGPVERHLTELAASLAAWPGALRGVVLAVA